MKYPTKPAAGRSQHGRRWWHGPIYVLRRLGHVGPLAVLTVLLPIVGGVLLVAYLNQVGAFLREYEAAAAVVFILVAAVMGAFSVLPTHALSLLGGFVFGFVPGLPVTMAAIILGALLGYALKTSLSRKRVMGLIQERSESVAVHAALVDGGFWWSTLVVTLIRLSPLAPFAATNLLMASTGVKRGAFILGTAAGMLPRCAAVVGVGDMLARLGRAEDSQQAGLLIVGMVATVAAVIAIGVASRRAVRRVAARPGPGPGLEGTE